VTTQIWTANDLGTIYCNTTSTSTVNSYFLPTSNNTDNSITYSLIDGNLPDNLTLDSNTGYIWGTLANTNIYKTIYYPLIQASTLAINTFTLTVRSANTSSIQWITPSNLGIITTGTISTLAVEAQILNSNAVGTYTLFSGTLTSGLSLNIDGTISGIPSSTGTYIFNVLITDNVNYNTSTQSFSIQSIANNTKSYTNILLKPLLKLDQRQNYQNFIMDSTIFPNDYIYRPFDNNFGIQTNIQMILYYGIQELNLSQYVFALQQNFYKRRFAFGDVKYSTATNSLGIVEYEAVYVEIIDKSNGSPLVIYDNIDTNNNTNIYYPASIDNMRTELSNISVSTGTTVSINNDLQPLFMNTYHLGILNPPKYVPVMILCYAKPEYGKIIANRIKESGFDFRSIDFEIDRIYIQNVLDSTSTKYLLMPRESVTSITPEDNYLYGPDGVEWIFDDNKPLTLE
jgi:hypothetical protein